jgi:photosystem II stability/assembly factor-like uncharacterized protein
LDAQHGWLLLTNTDGAGFSTFAVARTLDGGQTWQTIPLSLFQPGDPNSLVETIYLHFIDSSTGWLVIKRATSSNFSAGALFKTTDGGQTWSQLTLPIGEPVYFVTSEVGWIAGGAAGDALYQTQDGGRSWSRQSLLQPSLQRWPRWRYRLPRFENRQEGVLPVALADSDHSRVEFYVTHDGGQTWQLETSTSLDQAIDPEATLPLTVWGVGRWLMIAPHSNRILSLAANKRIATAVSPDDLTAGISELKMVTPRVGWARYTAGRCAPSPTGVSRCSSETRLLRTDDAGQSWVALTLPSHGDLIPESSGNSDQETGNDTLSGQAMGSETQTFIGQGFDKCEIASLSQLQNWIINSPYRAVNLYIGGSSRYCSNVALTASFVNQLKQQGWMLIPTWVGPQAACSSYASRMSYDPTTAYNQGSGEADAAIAVASNLGLTLADQSGTIIYYDLEYYNYNDAACHDAARAFISGWTGQLQAGETQAGVYGNGPPLNSFASLSSVPDAIWPAHWLLPYTYNPDATVWDVYGLSNSLWNNHQRIRQYAGGHNETWGGVTLNIDSNVIDGIVAPGPRSAVFLPIIVAE